MSVRSASQSPQNESPAVREHLRRYGHDLAWLMERLDIMDDAVLSQQQLINRLATLLFEVVDIVRGTVASPPAPKRVISHGPCRILPFSDKN